MSNIKSSIALTDLYEAMETARCEAMGARDMPGTAGN